MISCVFSTNEILGLLFEINSILLSKSLISAVFGITIKPLKFSFVILSFKAFTSISDKLKYLNSAPFLFSFKKSAAKSPVSS